MCIYIYKNYFLPVSSDTKLLSIPTHPNLDFKDAQSKELPRALHDNSQSSDGFKTIRFEG